MLVSIENKEGNDLISMWELSPTDSPLSEFLRHVPYTSHVRAVLPDLKKTRVRYRTYCVHIIPQHFSCSHYPIFLLL